MLVDFGDIKRTVQRWIDENLDHNMLLRRDDPILPVLQAQGERVFVMDVNPTAENIARLIFERTAAAGLPGHRGRPLGDPQLPRGLFRTADRAGAPRGGRWPLIPRHRVGRGVDVSARGRGHRRPASGPAHTEAGL